MSFQKKVKMCVDIVMADTCGRGYIYPYKSRYEPLRPKGEGAYKSIWEQMEEIRKRKETMTQYLRRTNKNWATP